MQEKKLFIVPDYFVDFVCKAGLCRHTCCQGWKVSLSYTEYMRLIGVGCSKKLRRILDCAFEPVPKPNPDKFVYIKQNEEKKCPVLRGDGLCELHKECTQTVLPAVCKSYPRAVHFKYAYEFALSGSCEAVIERLLRNAPVTFKTVMLDEKPPECARADKSEQFLIFRDFCFSIVQNRKYPLFARLRALLDFCRDADYAGASKNAETAKKAVSDFSFGDRYENGGYSGNTFFVQRRLAEWFEKNSVSLEGYTAMAEGVFGKDGGYEIYKSAKEKFRANYPDWQIIFENVLINHMFYEQFPFVDGCTSLTQSAKGLIVSYAFLKYMTLGCTCENENENILADVLSACFRLIEHTDFYKYANELLAASDCGDNEIAAFADC